MMDKQREKLIELICDNLQVDGCIAHCNYPPCDKCKTIADHLLANGVIVPPCKVGQTVWWADAEYEELLKGEVVSFFLQKEGLWAYCRYNGGLTYWHLVSNYFGKTVFLSREDAEKTLEERKEK